MKRSTKYTPDAHKIDLKRTQMLQQVERDAPSVLKVFRKAYTSASLRASVNAFCLECCWMDRSAIRECTAPACPLRNVRPYQKKMTIPAKA